MKTPVLVDKFRIRRNPEINSINNKYTVLKLYSSNSSDKIKENNTKL